MDRPLERTSQYRGDLRQTALPEMLALIHQARVAGVIEAVLGDYDGGPWHPQADAWIIVARRV